VTPPKYCLALWWLRTPWGTFPIAPLRGFIMLAALAAALAVVAVLVDWELGKLSRKGTITSRDWVAENKNINAENYRKIAASQANPLFRSVGYHPPPPAPGRKRILVIGDSFIWGDGYTNINILWWRQLGLELERRGYLSVDVIAAGLNGASTQDHLAWLRKPGFLAAAHPDLIVFGYVTNDPQIRDDSGKALVKVYVPPAQQQAAPAVLGVLRHQLAARKQADVQFNDEIGWPYQTWELKLLEGENFRRYGEVLKTLAATLAQASLPAVFVTTPNSPNKAHYDQRYPPVMKAFSDAGLELVDIHPVLLECCAGASPPLGWGINPANGHPGAKMSTFYARQVADLLEKRHPELLGPRSPEPLPAPLAINDWMPASVNASRVGAASWSITYPGNDERLLRLPVDVPHIAVNFERPAALRQVTLRTRSLDRYRVWAMALDENDEHELRDYVEVGSQRGPLVTLAIPEKLARRKITSLRIAREEGLTRLHSIGPVAAGSIQADSGNAYRAKLPALAAESDGPGHAQRSTLLLLEDGKPLPRPHAKHEEIRSLGGGRYSHWQDFLLFSASDGTDPRANGRRYELGRADDSPLELTLVESEPGRP
jgi:hypothetical protein